MNNSVYISTNCFQVKQLNRILPIAVQYGLKNIELSACHFDGRDISSFLLEAQQENSFRFLLHNYFPSPKEPFVLNLASNDPHVLDLSMEHCCRAIDLSALVGAPFYSVHTGFCYHTSPEQLGKKIKKFDKFPKETGRKIFIESLQALAEYARPRQVLLAIENNVLPAFALIDGKNEMLLGVTADDLLNIIETTSKDNVFVLVDVGHLKVAGHTLGFSPSDFIKDLSSKTIALHLSDNNGEADEHQSVHEQSWFWEPIRRHLPPDVHCVLELTPHSPGWLVEQTRLVSSNVKTIDKELG